MKSEARQKLLNEGARLVHRKGFHNTGIAEVVQAAGVPKGSFYFYFPSKEIFGLALIDEYAAFIQAVADDCWKDEAVPPLERIRYFFKRFRDFFEANDFKDGCPIGNLCLEMGDTNEVFRKKLAHVIHALRQHLENILHFAKTSGDLPKGDPVHLSGFIMSAWQGAILQMKVMRSTEPLDVFERMMFDKILK